MCSPKLIVFVLTLYSACVTSIKIEIDSEDVYKFVQNFMNFDVFRKFAIDNYRGLLKSEFKNPYHPEDNVPNIEKVTVSYEKENELLDMKLESENRIFLSELYKKDSANNSHFSNPYKNRKIISAIGSTTLQWANSATLLPLFKGT
ncbi:PREDICTED: uncharacterized protein LOC106122330 [Papilio xuthus]|uniref:Uncharacterized protein LOC106122330 n=1 Tax=Papilio xuthus TaxID=66420 RepID=A0AAJ6ZJM2_PAPXU|nr:PREDICTED: uncharacterized protein LOC106122330 [Papilio xuthus]